MEHQNQEIDINLTLPYGSSFKLDMNSMNAAFQDSLFICTQHVKM